MQHHGPDHEHTHLTAYERREFEFIEQTLASEDPGRPRNSDTRKAGLSKKVLWWALVLIAGWTLVFGVLIGNAPLVVLGITGATVAAITRRHRDSRENT